MPIVYVHGVATRDAEHPFLEIEAYLRRYVAPAICADPNTMPIFHAYWGELGARLAYGGISLPRSLLLGQGTETIAAGDIERALLASSLGAALPAGAGAEVPGGDNLATGLISGRAGMPAMNPLRLKDLTQDQLSNLLVELVASAEPDAQRRIALTLAADAAARDAALTLALASAPDMATECQRVAQALAAASGDGLVAQGGGWLQRMADMLKETLGRAASVPGAAATLVAAELRRPLNDFVSRFLGDAFVYLENRQMPGSEAPGPIQQVFLDRMAKAADAQRQRADEAIVVLSHSMGGQIVYDAVTHFMPRDPRFAGVRIALWCATASQVGYFEELKLFCASDPQYHGEAPAPFPAAHIDSWWNVWDPNDFISYSARGIFDRVDDMAYLSGMSLLGAHSSYLRHPSFFRQLRCRVEEALK